MSTWPASPPAYEYADARSVAEKGESLLSARTRTRTSVGPPGQSRAVDAGGAPLCLNVYKAGGKFFGNDDVVTLEGDKTNVVYYLSFPDKRTHFTLTRGGKEGPVVSEIWTGTLASKFQIAMANGWTTEMRWPATLAGNWDFVGPDRTSTYRWKSGSRVSMEFTLTNLANEDIVATWRRTGLSAKKGGQLLVSQLYVGEVELVVASALSVEEWCRVQVG